MFPEYRDLISQLKSTHPRFQSLFEKHNQLDHEIARLAESVGSGRNDEIARLKKEKLRLKDELHQILINVRSQQAS